MSSAPRPLRRAQRTLAIHSLLSVRHDCQGEQVVVRLLGGRLAQVLCADRCALDPGCGCDGVSTLRPGDVVLLPVGWRLFPAGALQVDDLKPAGSRRTAG